MLRGDVGGSRSNFDVALIGSCLEYKGMSYCVQSRNRNEGRRALDCRDCSVTGCNGITGPTEKRNPGGVTQAFA